MLFTITGRIKPYVRMTHRGKWTNPQAQEYLASKAAVGYQLTRQMADAGYDMMPDQTPLKVRLELCQPKSLHIADLDNIAKAVIDSAQGIVFRNDCWIDEIEASRKLGDNYVARFEVEIWQPSKTR